MRIIILSLIFIAFTIPTFSQSSIQGKVVDAETNEPIPFANVFFSGTLVGTTTDVDGNFSLDFFSEGKYDLIIKFVGYQEYFRQVDSSEEIPFLDVTLNQEVIELKEVYVNADTSGWENNYPSFKDLFLGRTENASKVEIANPRDIFLYYDAVDNGLFAHSRKEIVIENKALGYRMNYIMKDFQMHYRTGEFGSFGVPRFEELESRGKARMKRWKKERKRAYLGSFNHFLNSLISNTFSEEGFIVQELHMIPNKKRPSQELIDQKLSLFRGELRSTGSVSLSIGGNTSNMDSIRLWSRLNRLPALIDSLGVKYTKNDDLVELGKVINYKGYLRIIYTKEPEENNYSLTRPGGGVDNKQTSTVLFREPLKVYKNGYYDVGKVIFLGYFGWSSKIAEMLPLGYQPESE
ncbi:carboxypeptidase-like regulatory domain-containing protein [Ekhidna sp.]